MKFSSEFMEIVNDARGRVNEVSVEESREKVAGGANLIDVREDHEWEAGHAKGALHLARGIIERDIVDRFPDKATRDRPLLRYRLPLGALGRRAAEGWVIRTYTRWTGAGRPGKMPAGK